MKKRSFLSQGGMKDIIILSVLFYQTIIITLLEVIIIMIYCYFIISKL